MATQYSAEEQAAISRQYPEIVWRDGQPFTRETRPNLPSDTDDPNEFADAGMTENMIPADPSEGGVPWWMWAALAGGPAAAEGIGAGLGALGVGGGGAAALPVNAVPAAGITGAGVAPAAAGIVAPTAAGGAATGGAAAATTAATAAGGGGWLDRIRQARDIAQKLGPVFAGAAGASANADTEGSLIRANQYGTAQNAQMNLGRLDLDRNVEDRVARSTAMRSALANQHLSQSPTRAPLVIPGITPEGGLSIGRGLDDTGRAMASEAAQAAMNRYRTGNTYEGGKILDQPEVKTSGRTDLNQLALWTSLLGAGTAEEPPTIPPVRPR